MSTQGLEFWRAGGSTNRIVLNRTGLNDWKHASEYIGSYERSPTNSNSLRIFLQRSTNKDGADAESLEVFESEFRYMKNAENVLHRVVKVVKLLATRGLAFKGSEKKFGCQTNGKILGIIELISQYDLFLAEHLVKYGNLGSGKTSYLAI